MFKNKTKKKNSGNMHPYEMDIISFNTQYSNMSIYADSTVLKTPDSVLKANLYSKENRFLSEQYLLNYKTNNESLGFRMGLSNFYRQSSTLTCANKELEEELDDAIELVKPKNIKASLGATIKLRRSVRNYVNNKLSMQELSNILYYAQGVSAQMNLDNNGYGNDNIKLKNNPSAGGLYPINLYMYLSNVEEIEDGFYLYYPYSHSIKPINLNVSDLNQDNFAELVNIATENINVFFIYVYNLHMNSRKYGDAGMNYALIEAGEIAQNVQLTATAIGYGSCDIGGYEKQYLEKLLKIDGITNHVVHMTIVGKEGS
ncbi:SagB family peptide dehydrogenase [Romboutsia sedimentorum]|uniref:SagB family peptide dehydrogenase n=1 Tax=Romboutsia sedimentorum TaxID=1368474 RepID=UPI0024DE8CA2|nr:SagB family peptide dehydrogenase [Romboutsia sedimentorum]MDK2584518.1 SagB family peptide dehydrogenase [Romboutsia sedimentorum]